MFAQCPTGKGNNVIQGVVNMARHELMPGRRSIGKRVSKENIYFSSSYSRILKINVFYIPTLS
jgi:hypothetical protein